MVYYPISSADLILKIGADWNAKASARTAANVAAQRLVHSDSIWSDIKHVYMAEQFDKCVYCEFPLGGKITQDVEHYRPKSRISKWPKKGAYPIATGAAQAGGYYWLAYDPHNYAASCKDCNSTLKSDCFPISGARGSATAPTPALNTSEQPLLLFPFGDWGDDPAHYFAYEGIFVQPKANLSAPKRSRAQVTIDFFKLNSRPALLRLRYQVIDHVWTSVELRETSSKPAIVARAERSLLEITNIDAPQSLCARAFLDLMTNDPSKATAIADAARAHLTNLGYFTRP